MLEGLRKVSNNWIGKLFLTVVMGFLSIAFGVWGSGVGDLVRHISGNNIAKVGSTDVPAEEFQRTYQRSLNQIQTQTRQIVTSAKAHEMGVDAQVLGSLLSNAALDQTTKNLNMALSEEETARIVAADPTYAGPDGRFTQDNLLRILQNAQMSEQTFIQEQRAAYLRNQLVQGLIGGMKLPNVMVDALYRYAAETRSVDYVILPPSLVGTIDPPDDATLQKFYDSHKSAFAAPEYRQFVTLAVTPATIADPNSVTDADAQAVFDKDPAKYQEPEKRDMREIVFPNLADAQAAAAKIKAGSSFDAIVAERQLNPDDVNLGTHAKADLIDKNIADAAFALNEGGVSDVVTTNLGPAILQVQKIVPAVSHSYADVAADIKRDLAVKKAIDSVQGLHDKVEDMRVSGKPLSDIAKELGLTVTSIASSSAGGLDKDGKAIPDFVLKPQVLKAVFASDVGADNEALNTKDQGYVWFEVAKIDAAHDRPLADVKSEAETAWRADETTKRLAKMAMDFEQQLNSGTSLADIAAKAGNLEIKHVVDAKRSGTPDLIPAATVQVFDLPIGGAGSATVNDGRMLFKVIGTSTPPLDPASNDVAQITAKFSDVLPNDMAGEYVARLQKDLGVTVNQQELRAVIGLDQN